MTPGPFSGACSIWAGCSNLGSGGTVADVQEVAGLRNTMHGTLRLITDWCNQTTLPLFALAAKEL
jgi:hypothetical protein